MSFLDDGLRVTVNGINGLGKGMFEGSLAGMFNDIYPMIDVKATCTREACSRFLPEVVLLFSIGHVPHQSSSSARRI